MAKAKSVNIPFKPEQIGKLLLLENPDNPLQQFIILPIIDTSDDTVHEVLVTDPKTALFRILNLGKGKELHVVKDANGTGTILVMVATDGIKYLPNASTLVATKMKDAASIDKLSALPKAELADAAVTWNSVLIPTGEKVLTAEPNNTGIVAVTATEAGVIKGIRLFASVSDATGKFIPILEATKYTLRKMIVTPDIGKLATDLAFTIKDKNSASFLVMHSADILTENPIFTMLTDKAAVSEELEKADSKSKVKNSEKVSGKKKDKTKKNDKDEEDDKLNDTFKELLAEALVAGKVGQPVVSHAFEDYGDKLATLVIQDGGLGLVKIDNGTIVSKKDEQLSLGTEGSACGSFIDALPVDLDNAGGKDVALFINNGDMVSMVVYPNINQVQKFESVTAEANGGTIQLHQKSVTEENESLNCKWEAYKKENDGTLTDVTSQLDNPNSCDPIFKPGAPASKTSLLEKPSILGTVAQWLVAQMSISTAYAEEATTPTDYVFRVTTTDPDGLQATAQVTTQISATKAVQGTALTSDQGLTNQGLTNITSDSLEIKIVEVKMPTPAPIDEAKTSGTTTSPVTPLNVGETTGIGAQALAPQPSAPPIPTAGGDVMESGGGMHAFATEGGCSLTRNTVPLTSMGWLWVLPLLAFIPTRAICYQRSPRRPSRCRWGHGRRH